METVAARAAQKKECVVFWFRRDLRLEDNCGLFQALSCGLPVLPLFIFDSEILKHLPETDARVEFIYNVLLEIDSALRSHGTRLQVEHGKVDEVWRQLLKSKKIIKIFCNEDYEPYALKRDAEIAQLAAKSGVEFLSFKDQVVFARNEVVKEDGSPYRVFTPYSRRWRALLKSGDLQTHSSHRHLDRFLKSASQDLFPSLLALGFKASGIEIPERKILLGKIKVYAQHRDFLGEDATTHLGLHLRFGTLSVRKLVTLAQKHSDTYLNELIWREFFMQILFHYPHSVDEPFDPRFKNVKWRNDETDFKRWCEGETGYAIVDAAMKQINRTGFMHNRARMIVASFLCKHLLIHWKWGERYFAQKLLDFELASNVGNWQWSAGCGCDAAPYFRVFNPLLQAKKFDAEGVYVKTWLEGPRPKPMIEHDLARNRAIHIYTRGVKGT